MTHLFVFCFGWDEDDGRSHVEERGNRPTTQKRTSMSSSLAAGGRAGRQAGRQAGWTLSSRMGPLAPALRRDATLGRLVEGGRRGSKASPHGVPPLMESQVTFAQGLRAQ